MRPTFRGDRFARHPFDLKNCTEALVLSQPKIIEDIHRAYLEAGADIIETDTFNGTALSLEEFGLQDHVAELNKAAVELARRVADEFTRKDPGQAPLRRRQHRADQEAALHGHPRRGPGPSRRDLRRDGGDLQAADPRA